MASVRMVTDSFDPRPHLALLSSPSKSSLFPQPTHFRGHTTYNYSNPKCATGHSFFRAEEEALGSILGIHLCLGAAAWSPSAPSYCRTWMYTYSASNDKGHKAVASILTPPVVVYSKAGARSTAMPTLASMSSFAQTPHSVTEHLSRPLSTLQHPSSASMRFKERGGHGTELGRGDIPL